MNLLLRNSKPSTTCTRIIRWPASPIPWGFSSELCNWSDQILLSKQNLKSLYLINLEEEFFTYFSWHSCADFIEIRVNKTIDVNLGYTSSWSNITASAQLFHIDQPWCARRCSYRTSYHVISWTVQYAQLRLRTNSSQYLRSSGYRLAQAELYQCATGPILQG